MAKTYPFEPTFAIPPGETLRETLEFKGLSQKDLATRTGLAEKTISQIINGVHSLSFDTASKLERVLGVPARFWNNLERNYQEARTAIEESERRKNEIGRLSEFPISALIKRGYLKGSSSKEDRVKQLLEFFGVSDWNSWEVLWSELLTVDFRKSNKTNRKALIATWLRIGEIEALARECGIYDAEVFKNVLHELRGHTNDPPEVFQHVIENRCAKTGVAVVFVKEFPGAGVSGATRWLSKDKALIQLSLKFKCADQLWFTFFHEACHVLKHGRKEMFIEDDGSGNKKEEEADRFASDLLIPPSKVRFLSNLQTEKDICDFATSIGIAPGIVVGRMQHDKLIPFSSFNGLKQKLIWAN